MMRDAKDQKMDLIICASISRFARNFSDCMTQIAALKTMHRSMNLKCRLYRSKWVQSITVSDVMESGQVVENPMIGAIPSRNEVQRELDDLLMSMYNDRAVRLLRKEC